MDNTFESIKNDLISLGVHSGDTVFLRISYKAIGKIEGGPKTFLDAIINVVGKDGTVILTAFPKRYNNKLRVFHRKDAVDQGASPKSITGAMSNVALQYSGSMVSSRKDFPFVALGKHAHYLTSNHSYDKEGYWILEEAIDKFNCKCLRVGGKPFIGTTHFSLSHIMREKGAYQIAPRYGVFVKDKNKLIWRENNNVVFCPTAFNAYLPEIIEDIKISEGKIGAGYAIITDMKKSMQAEEALFRKDLNRVLCSDPGCCLCRTTFSFSDSTKSRFLKHQIGEVFRGNGIRGVKRIIGDIETYMLFTTKNN